MMPPAQLEHTTTQDTLEDMRAEVELYESPRPSDQANQSSSSTGTSSSTSKTDSPTPPLDEQQTSSGGCQMQVNDERQQRQQDDNSQSNANNSIKRWPTRAKHEVRLLVRRREAGALIGKKGANIKRLREHFHESSFNIPDTGNGPERVVIIAANSLDALESILLDVVRLFQEKQMFQPDSNSDPQVEMKMLINSSHAGLLIGVGGQSIRKLRNDTKAALKIYEMCCPHSSERVCAVKARPPVVVSAMRTIHKLLVQSPVKGPHKAYDALNFELSLADKYGGYTCDNDDSPAQFNPPPHPPPTHFEHHLMHQDHHVAHHLPAVVHQSPVTSNASSSPYLSQASHYLAAAAAAAVAAGSPFLRDSLYQPPARLLAAAAAAAATAANTTNRRPHASQNFCDRLDSSCPVRGGYPADRFHPYSSTSFGANRFQRNFAGSRNYSIARSEANKCARPSSARTQQQQLRSSPGDNQPVGGGATETQVKHQ